MLTNGNDRPNVFKLTPAETTILKDAFQTASALKDGVNDFIIESSFAGDYLPPELRRELRCFRWSGNQNGFLLVKNCPRDEELAETPTLSGEVPQKATDYSERMLSILGESLGNIVSYRAEHAGDVFSWLFPTQKNADKLSSESSNVPLDIHTEMAFLTDLSPTEVLLYCHRQDHDLQAYTTVSSVRQFICELTPTQIKVLSGRNFRTGIDYSFGAPNGLKGMGPETEILYGNPLDPCIRLDVDLMEGKTRDARNALRDLTQIVKDFEQPVLLEPGDCIVIDNRYSVHGRRKFTPRWDGNDRLLQRSLVLDSPTCFRDVAARGGRVIDIDLSEHYADVAPS